MKALVISAAGQTGYIEHPQPTPAPGEVLLQVKRLGFCGTDLNTFRGDCRCYAGCAPVVYIGYAKEAVREPSFACS